MDIDTLFFVADGARLHGTCPHCGFSGAAYANHAHFVAGDW